jgi:hypothetical protein
VAGKKISKDENTKLGTSIHMVIAIEIWTKSTT